MRILVATGIFPPDLGGPATYVPVVAGGWAAQGDHVTVITMSDTAGSSHTDPFTVVRVARRRRAPVRWAAAARAIAAAAGEADVIYAVGLLPQAALAAALRRRPLVARVVSDLAWDRAAALGWTRDDLSAFHRRRYGPRIEGLRAIQRWALRRADRIIVPSEWLAAWARQEGGSPLKVRVIPNALPPLPAVRPARPAVPTPRVLATSGRLVPVKRIDLAIRALTELPEASLLIIGDGPERGMLAALASDLGLGARVVFAGGRPREEMLALLAGCDALVQCSAHEGFPFAVLEAMALGVPVIATAVGGVTEILHDGVNGVLVDGAHPGLTQAVRRVLADPAFRAGLIARARTDAASRSSDAMVGSTRAVLVEAAA